MLVFTNYPLRTLRDCYQYKNTLPCGGCFCIGDPNTMNFELLLSPEYYLATMRLYEEIKRNNLISLQLSQTFDNDISLNEAKHYHSPPLKNYKFPHH